MYRLIKFIRCSRGATAVEFAFIMPLLLLISFGVMEFSGLFFQYHKVNEATRVIARNLATTAPLVSEATLIANTTHTCTTDTCTDMTVALAGTSAMLPNLTSNDIEITYEVKDIGNVGYSGGFKPMITVKLTNLAHSFVVLGAFPGMPESIALNPSETSLLGRWY